MHNTGTKSTDNSQTLNSNQYFCINMETTLLLFFISSI